ncbi:osteocalcin 2 [Oryzias melastigma]|uniref:osteocalcin 2 n=1 Tax=Oryzias melastigma TaxID=30732 RepID=UPI000CF80BB8|nr:osteocalcin 2 [Oryzias melastigma]
MRTLFIYALLSVCWFMAVVNSDAVVDPGAPAADTSSCESDSSEDTQNPPVPDSSCESSQESSESSSSESSESSSSESSESLPVDMIPSFDIALPDGLRAFGSHDSSKPSKLSKSPEPVAPASKSHVKVVTKRDLASFLGKQRHASKKPSPPKQKKSKKMRPANQMVPKME